MIRVLGLALYGHMAASTRYRLAQYIPGLAEHGIRLDVECLLGDEYLLARYNGGGISWGTLVQAGIDRLRQIADRRRYDLALVYGEVFPLMPQVIERSLLRLPYIYDFDDAFFLRYRTGWKRIVAPLLGDKFDRVMGNALAVTAGSSYLADYAARWNANTILLPTVVDTRRYSPLRTGPNEVFTIGWIGSPTTAPYLKQLIDPLERIAAESPLRLVVIGGEAPTIPGVSVVSIPWREEEEVSLLNGFDVGVMPLPDDDWARGKCAFKLIQYMACGIPVVASRVGANVDVVTPDCGYLVGSVDEWCDALRTLRNSEYLRVRMGAASRRRIEAAYSLDSNLPILVDLISSVAGYHD